MGDNMNGELESKLISSIGILVIIIIFIIIIYLIFKNIGKIKKEVCLIWENLHQIVKKKELN